MQTQIDTLAAELRQKAETALASHHSDDWYDFNYFANPVNILALFDDRDRLKAANA